MNAARYASFGKLVIVFIPVSWRFTPRFLKAVHGQPFARLEMSMRNRLEVSTRPWQPIRYQWRHKQLHRGQTLRWCLRLGFNSEYVDKVTVRHCRDTRIRRHHSTKEISPPSRMAYEDFARLRRFARRCENLQIGLGGFFRLHFSKPITLQPILAPSKRIIILCVRRTDAIKSVHELWVAHDCD